MTTRSLNQARALSKPESEDWRSQFVTASNEMRYARAEQAWRCSSVYAGSSGAAVPVAFVFGLC